MKILLLTDGISPFVIGGMQKHSYLLVKYLAGAGVKVELHHCIYGNAPLPDTKSAFSTDENQNITAFGHRFPNKGVIPGHYVRNSYQYSIILFGAVKNRLSDFDFIYTKGFAAWKLLEEKQKGLKMPKVGVKFHGYEMFQPPADLKSKLQFKFLQKPTLKLNKLADIVFSYGGKITDLILDLGVPKQNLVEIPGAIEDEYIRKEITPTSKILKFVFVGRYERRKGIIELHQALLTLAKAKQSFEFHFVGPIPQEKQIIANQIIYHGELSAKKDIFDILDKCDIMVVPSHSEGMPNVILEGMAKGCGIIATDVGAVGLLVNEQNGILLSNSKPTSILSSMLTLINKPSSEIDQMKLASLQKVKLTFTWEVIVKEFLSKISKVVK